MKKIRRFFDYLKHFWLSRYGFGIIFVAFAVWVIFFDDNSKISQHQLAKENVALKKDTTEGNKVIAELQFQIKALTDSLEVIEKYAREHYQMQVKNEDVFLFEK